MVLKPKKKQKLGFPIEDFGNDERCGFLNGSIASYSSLSFGNDGKGGRNS